MLTKIISGGQTGADQGALRAAKALGLATGGWAPKGFRTEDGYNSSLRLLYSLQEHSSHSYPPRTQCNILASDGTLIFGNPYSSGSMLTQRYADRYGKPLYLYPWQRPSRRHTVIDVHFTSWLMEHKISILNVAGNRESQNFGIADAIFDYLILNLADALRLHPIPNVKLEHERTSP
jgi:hypothetical protein